MESLRFGPARRQRTSTPLTPCQDRDEWMQYGTSHPTESLNNARQEWEERFGVGERGFFFCWHCWTLNSHRILVISISSPCGSSCSTLPRCSTIVEMHLSYLNRGNHTHKPHKTWLENLAGSPASTYTHFQLSLSWITSLIVGERKGPCSCLRRVLPALQEAAQLSACSLLTWASSLQSIMTDYRLLPEEPCEDGSSPGGKTQRTNHCSKLTRKVHITLVTWHARPASLWLHDDPRDVWDNETLGTSMTEMHSLLSGTMSGVFLFVFVCPFRLSVSLCFRAQGHWEMTKSLVSVLSELLMGHLWLSASWQAN